MAKEKTPDECPMNHECAFKLIAAMEQAQKDIEYLKKEQKETTGMVREIHEAVLKFGSGFSGFKIGVRVTVFGMIAVVLGAFSIVYLFATGQISFKDLINWLL